MSIEVDPLTAFVDVDVSGDVVEVEVVGQGEKGDPGGGAFDGDASDVPYTPATEGDWDPVPAQVAEALDELAARESGGGGAVDSVNGQTGAVVLDAGDVGADPAGTAAGLVDDLSGVTNAATARSNLGLGNVDNTSDANKPVSSAQQTALDGKAATSHSHSGADITSGTVATARLGSGTADATTFLRGDQTWAAAGGLAIPTAKLSGATDRDWTIPGVIVTSITTWTSSTNRAAFQPIVVTAARNYDLIGVEVVTAAAAGKRGRVAIYTIDDYWQPDVRVWQSATFAIDPASVPSMVTTTGPGVLDAGPYMVIFTMDASPTLRVLNVYPPMDSPIYFAAGGGAFRAMTSITSRPTYVASGFPALAATDSLYWDYASAGSATFPAAIRFREAA